MTPPVAEARVVEAGLARSRREEAACTSKWPSRPAAQLFGGRNGASAAEETLTVEVRRVDGALVVPPLAGWNRCRRIS